MLHEILACIRAAASGLAPRYHGCMAISGDPKCLACQPSGQASQLMKL